MTASGVANAATGVVELPTGSTVPTVTPALPYTWLARSGHFGFASKPEWKPAPVGQEGALAAAQQQHELARGVREWKQRNRKSDKHLAAALDVHPETIGRYLRGETPVDLTTFNYLAHTAGLHVALTLDDASPS